MRLLSSMTLRTVVPVLLCLGGLSVICASQGCSDAGDGGQGWGGAPADETLTTNPDTVAIDTGATLSSPGGGGVGVFVQYAAGGHWTVTTACDTATSGEPCGFDVFVAGADASTTLSNPAGTNLGDGDNVDIQRDGSYHLSTLTSTTIEGMTFDATPGGTLALEMFLDGVPQPRFVYWIGGKVLHTGAPTDPINLHPSEP
jgi:hypothetical protein